jgi:hypothetical protein
MSENYPVPRPGEQDSNAQQQVYDDRVEDPPFVYLGFKHPADIASDLPAHVYSFEQAWKEAKPVKVFELLGKPFFLREKQIDDKAIGNELDVIINVMRQNNISIAIPAGKNARDIYRFVTEVLFEQEVDDLKMGCLGRNFIYRDDYSS